MCFFGDKWCFFLGMAHFFDSADEITALFNGVNVSLGDELRIGIFDGNDADLEMLRKTAFAWKLFAC